MNRVGNDNCTVELLAPAGDMDCFMAAVNAGADAVYLGLPRYSARVGAKNLTHDELKRALEISHICGRKIYLTVNTLFKDDELEELPGILEGAYKDGLHGVIVQDVGAMSVIHRYFPDLPIHVSTQAAITSAKGCALLKDLGITRVVPARELSLEEIRKLKDESGLEIECFIHGSLCYSYSGKCLLSSFIGGRSGNRGRCAQPCRLKYNGSYPLSLKDLCTVDLLPELADAGISSFKIEGRMKSSGYVYGVTSIYRKYIDIYLSGKRYEVTSEDREKLISLYTRSGNCDGYYMRHNDRHMITPDSPSYESNTADEDIRMITRIPSIPVKVSCTVRKGMPAKIRVFNGSYDVLTETGVMADEAVNRNLTADEIKEQLLKSGGTGFTVESVDVDVEDGLFAPKSALNAIRREGLDAFRESIISRHIRQMAPVGNEHVNITISGRPYTDNGAPSVNVAVLTVQQLKAAVQSRADGVIVPISLMDGLKREALSFGNKNIYIRLPIVIREDGKSNSCSAIMGSVDRISREFDIAGYYVSNAESVTILRESGYEGRITADIHMYAYNAEAYDLYRKNGIDITTVPVELNFRELARRGISGEELIIYGRLPVMVSANCIYNTEKGCEPSDIGHSMYLRDRKGEKLFVSCICRECTNVYYNSAVLSISDERALFESIRPTSVRFEFTDEDAGVTTDIIERYYELRNADGSTREGLIDKYTKGHLKRGVD